MNILNRTIFITALILSAASASMAAVTITDLGNEVILDNGIVSATFEKSTARILSLKHDGDELIGNGGVGYIQQNFDDAYSSPSTATYTLVTDQTDHKDISFTWYLTSFKMEYHYVLRDGDSGFYAYMICDYDHSRGGDSEMQQFNLAIRSDPDIFTRAYVEDHLIYDMPHPDEIVAGTTLSPSEAILLADGSIHYKYLYINHIRNLDAHGWTGLGKGLWIVSGCNEYVNGAPSSQELTLHQSTTTNVLLKHFTAAHYGSGTSSFDASETGWEKIYGPFMIYLNENADPDLAWQDAKNKAAQEKTAWPYSWMNNPVYPLAADRGTVTGTLNITDGSSSEDAMVILAQPTDGTPDTNWQRQGKNYIAWTRAAADGTFTIDKVRPGTYTLYSFVEGVLDEYTQDGITVTASATNNIGTIDWTPKKFGREIFQIGTADRTSAEFFRGDDYRHFGLWFQYPIDFPTGINYTVGTSNPATDWNFTQWCVENPDGSYRTSPYTINFDMDKIFGDKAHLTVAVAAGRNPTLKVLVNGTEVFNEVLPVSDGTGARPSNQGYYQQQIITFDSSLLNAESTNTIVLEQTRKGLFYCLLYDCIRLETSAKGDVNKDGEVDLKDAADISRDWLKCTNPQKVGCINLN